MARPRVGDLCRDWLIRRKAGFARFNPSRYRIEVARTVAQYEQAYRLVYVGYAYRGILPVTAPTLRMTDQHLLPEATVIVAYEGEEPVGTITLTTDSPAGLPLEDDYPEQIHALRRGGESLGEIGSYVVVGRCRGSGIAQGLAMAAIQVGLAFGVDRFVIGVHPRTRDFYRALWSMAPLGEPRHHVKLRAATAGMSTTRSRVLRHLERHFPRPLAGGSTAAEYIRGEAELPGLALPSAWSDEELARWKMSREVFRELFIERTNRLAEVNETTRQHLARRRSEETLRRIPLGEARNDGPPRESRAARELREAS